MTVPRSAEATFSRLFLAGVLFRVLLGSVIMLVAAGGVQLGRLTSWDWAPFVLACAGLLIGFVLTRPLKRRWDPLNKAPEAVPATLPIDPNL